MHAARIIDANANRAREALRVLEDIARFTLDSQPLSTDLKALRHELRDAIASSGFDDTQLLAWRDTPADVGTRISTPAEMDRPGLPAVAAAAAARLTEALRAIEECLKIAEAATGAPTPAAAQRVEAIRYRAYEADKRLRLMLGTATAPQWRLCVLITEALCLHHPWEAVAAAAIEGGADCLQLREKSLPDAQLLHRARRLVEIARGRRPPGAARVAVIINDRPDIALAASADGVHLGQDDLPVHAVRRLAGSSLLVGISTSNIQQARAAAAEGADYCGLGPMFETTTKVKPVLARPAYVAEYLAAPSLRDRPHLAIGGITPENAGELVAVGCRGIAVSAAVCKAQRPAVACRALRDGFAPTH